MPTYEFWGYKIQSIIIGFFCTLLQACLRVRREKPDYLRLRIKRTQKAEAVNIVYLFGTVFITSQMVGSRAPRKVQFLE